MELKRERGPGTRTRYEVDVPTVWVGSLWCYDSKRVRGTDHPAANEQAQAAGGDGEQTEGFGASDAVCIMHAFASRAAAICR